MKKIIKHGFRYKRVFVLFLKIKQQFYGGNKK